METSDAMTRDARVPGLNSAKLRTADVARRAGCSVQQVRNLERDGVLPPAVRTDTGYRTYAPIHVHSLLAYKAFAVAVGPVEAKKLMRAFHRSRTEFLAMLDVAHAGLHAERAGVHEARQAVAAISGEPIGDVRAEDAMSVSELANALGVRASTLRHWDAEALVVPSRERGARRYTPAQVRDARIVYQLRKAGYRIDALRALLPELRKARRLKDVSEALDTRGAAVTARSQALLEAASALSAIETA